MLRGLFIGIDRYRAPVNRLSCAVADARALGSLFADTLEGQASIVVDDEATGQRIRDELRNLQTVEEDDLVVIAFSGHGTETHELVPVDVDPANLLETTISLDELAQALDQIPSKNLIVFLDCCFSGGFGGARVFSPSSARSAFEDRTQVEALARGEGRIVVAASAAGEPALETAGLGHGLLSFHLVHALQGAESLVVNGRIALLDLFNYVMRQVQLSANAMHEVQTPSLYGSVDGAPTIARLMPGPLYAQYFPERVRPEATEAWSSLLPYGIAQEVLDLWAAQMPGLNHLQLRAINEYRVLDGCSVLVVAPTGSGKTMIGELSALQAVGQRSRAVVLLPLRALVNDKFEAMRATYGDTMKIVRATGEHSDQIADLMTGQYDIALLTYEKFLSLSLGTPHLLRGIAVVVVDEVQTLSDRTRGANLEFLLTVLRAGIGRIKPPQIVALSAVIGDTHDFERWLGGGLLRTTERPVPLRERVVDQAGSIRTLEPDGTETEERGGRPELFHDGSQESKPYVVPLVRQLASTGKKVIVFRTIKAETVGTALYLGQLLGLPAAENVLEALPAADLSAASQQLRRALAGGVGFHNADLDRDERAALEASFRNPASPLRVLVATTTLAMGINTPAEAVIILGLTHPGQPPIPYTVAEYKNMAGRAGRPGHTEAGESYIVASSAPPAHVAWTTYVKGRPEEIQSQLLADGGDTQTLILHAVLALGGSVYHGRLIELLENSFAMWQRVEQGFTQGWDSNQLQADLASLVRAQLLDEEPDGRITLTQLGRYASESGIEVRSVSQVASLLRFAPEHLPAAALILLAQVTLELDDTYIRTHNKSRQEQNRWPQTCISLGVPSQLLRGLHVGGGRPTLRAKRAAACLLLMTREPFGAIEQALLQHTPENSAAGPIRQVAARTRDVIDVVANIATYYGKVLPADTSVDDLALQLELGIPSESLELARRCGNSLTRGDYLALLDAGYVTSADIVEAEEADLAKLLDASKAQLLKAETADVFVG
jgi:replicative superfamily II helicase